MHLASGMYVCAAHAVHDSAETLLQHDTRPYAHLCLAKIERVNWKVVYTHNEQTDTLTDTVVKTLIASVVVCDWRASLAEQPLECCLTASEESSRLDSLARSNLVLGVP